MQHILDQFLDYIEFELNYSITTVDGYDGSLKNFLSVLKKKRIKRFEDVTEQICIDYLLKRQVKRFSPSSYRSHANAIRCFFKYLKRDGIIPQDIARNIRIPKISRRVRMPLSYEKIKVLLEKPDDTCFFGAMSKAVLEILYGSGLRATETCNLKICDFDLERKTVHVVKGKGNKDRLVPINPSCVKALSNYWKMRRNPQETAFAFVQNHQGEPLDRMMLNTIVKKYAKECGFTEYVSPHILRHAYATHLLDRGADIRVIQELLGHTDIATTGHYLHSSMADIRKKFDKFHPKSIHNRIRRCFDLTVFPAKSLLKLNRKELLMHRQNTLSGEKVKTWKDFLLTYVKGVQSTMALPFLPP